ncbi:hypothetical protein [Bacteroides fluxus]|nr:hypothetical protein [Bacteroides fluxus]
MMPERVVQNALKPYAKLRPTTLGCPPQAREPSGTRTCPVGHTPVGRGFA